MTVSVLAAVLLAVGGLVAQRAADRQQQREKALLAASYPSTIREAAQALDARQDSEAETLLEACPAELRGWEWHYLQRLRVTPGAAVLPADTAAVMAVAFGPEGTRLAAGYGNGSAVVWDCGAGKKTVLTPKGFPVLGVAFRPDGRRLAVANGTDWLNLLPSGSRWPEQIHQMPTDPGRGAQGGGASPRRFLPAVQGERPSGRRETSRAWSGDE